MGTAVGMEWLRGNTKAVFIMVASALGLAVWLGFPRRRPRKLPPGPLAMPILGSLPFIRIKGRELHVALDQMAKRYNTNICHVWFGKTLAVSLHSYELIREAMVDHAAVMAGRPQTDIPNYNGNKKGIVFATYSPAWKHDRTISLSILKDFGFGKRLMEDRIVQEVDAMLNHLDTVTDTAFDPAHAMQVSVSNVICSVVLGKHFKHDDKQFIDMLETMDEFLGSYMDINDAEFIPVLRLLPSKKRAMQRFLNSHDKLLDFLMAFIKHHQKCHVRGDSSDFIHAYLDRSGDEADQESLLYIIRDFLVAGTETTSTTLRWAFVYMANNPDIQRNVQEELVTVLGRDRLASLDNKAHLPYTEAVIQEVQRLAAVAPQLIPHVALDDVTVAGYSIPKGTMVLGNLWAVFRDPDLWPEPDKFKAERFLTEDGKVLHRPELIPFGLGRRSCLGEMMARQEIFLFFTAILHNYNITKPDGVDRIDETGRDVFTRVPNHYAVILEKRL